MTAHPKSVALDFVPAAELTVLEPPERCESAGLFSVLPGTTWYGDCVGLYGRDWSEIRLLAAVRPGEVRIYARTGRYAAYAISRPVRKPCWKWSDGPDHIPWTEPGALADGVLLQEFALLGTGQGKSWMKSIRLPIPRGTRYLLLRTLDATAEAVPVSVRQIAVADDDDDPPAEKKKTQRSGHAPDGR